MSELRDRIYRLTVHRQKQTATERKFFLPLPDGVVISGMQIQFTIEKSVGSTPNTCDIKVCNLSPRTRADLQRDGTVCTFEVGYDNTPRRVFVGDVIHAHSEKQGTEWITDIQLGDGSKAFAGARVNRQFKGGTSVLAVLQEAAKSMNLALPKNVVVSKDLASQFAAGYALNGRTRDELTRLLAPYGYSWSIQSGQLQILLDEEVRPDRIRILSEDKGMIASPIYGRPERKGQQPRRSVRCLIYPELTPGGRVQIESRALNGIFKIEKAKHTGDFEGQDWSTEVEVKSV